ENTHNVKNTPLLKSIIEDQKESVLRKSVSSDNSGIHSVKQGDSSPLAPGGGLAAHEAKGGHLIERHVGKTDEELLQRLQINKKIRASSSFTDRPTAERVANETLTKHKKEIEEWLKSDVNDPLPLPYRGTEVIGRGVRKGSNEVKDMTNARIVLKKNEDGSFILTGYPTR
ncbi:RNase A-like domain-containing protein, partial [Bacillus velezensis]